MSKKSFEDLVNLLKKENYNFKFFQAESTGNFLPEDSNWNYKDVVHAKFVHPGLNNVQACALGDVTSSINLLKLPFLGLSIPLVCVMYEQSRFKLVYFSSFGPYIIVNNTNSERIDSKKTKVTTSYAIGSKGIFKYFHKIIEKMILKNYQLLMADDMPMRNRRGELRNLGHKFYSDNQTSFSFTEEINRANVYLDQNVKSEISIKKSSLLSCKQGEKIGETSGILSFFITEEGKKKKMWPAKCSHEGAYLTSKCIKNGKIFCPWHNKVTKPLIIIDESEKNKFNIVQCVDYLITDEKEAIKIKFRNDPKYYDKNYK